MNEELIKQLKEKVKELSPEDRMMVLMAALANLQFNEENA